jgi:hypothetical protein
MERQEFEITVGFTQGKTLGKFRINSFIFAFLSSKVVIANTILFTPFLKVKISPPNQTTHQKVRTKRGYLQTPAPPEKYAGVVMLRKGCRQTQGSDKREMFAEHSFPTPSSRMCVGIGVTDSYRVV